MSKWKVGDFREFSHAISADDVANFARISGDKNPIHLDLDVAKASRFGERIVHGMLVASQFSRLIAEAIPGPGSIYLAQELKFSAPVFYCEPMVIRVEIESITNGKIYRLHTFCTKENGDVAISGLATILWQGDKV